MHVIAAGGWSDGDVLAEVREIGLPKIAKQEAIKAWMIDATGFPTHGVHSVGVAHRYCGQLGKQAPHFARYALMPRMRGFVVVSIEKAQIIHSPIYDDGATEAELRKQWLDTYTKRHGHSTT